MYQLVLPAESQPVSVTITVIVLEKGGIQYQLQKISSVSDNLKVNFSKGLPNRYQFIKKLKDSFYVEFKPLLRIIFKFRSTQKITALTNNSVIYRKFSEVHFQGFRFYSVRYSYSFS